MYLTLRDRPGASESGTGRRRVSRTVIVLGMVSLLTDVSSESVAAILPVYLTVVIGLSPVAYGLIDGLYQGVSSLVRLGGGWLADRTDRPKAVAFVGYGLSAVSRFAMLVATGAGTIATIVSVDRIGKGIRTAPRDAMIAASSPQADLGHAFGVHRTLDTIGAAIGPLIAFVVLWMIPDGYTTVFVISLGFALVGLALLGLLAPDQRLRSAAEDGPTPPPFRWSDLRRPGLMRLVVLAGFLGLLTVGDGFIYLTLLDRGGFGAHWFPMLYVGTNIAFLALAIPFGRLADRIGRAKVLVGGHLTLVAAYLAAALPTGAAWATVLTLVLLGAFYAATDGVIAALAGRLVPVQARSSGIAAAQTAVTMARMLASAGFGVLWLLVGPGTAMLVVAGGLTLAVAGAVTQVRRLETSAA